MAISPIYWHITIQFIRIVRTKTYNVGNGVLTAPWVMTVLNIKTLPRLYLSRLGKP
jgi:hypothetical protein